MKKGKILAIAVIVMIIVVAVWGAFKPTLIPTFNLVLLAGLIGVTTVYAYTTIRQADASVRMAEEMREQRLAMYKPNIVLDRRGSTRGRYFVEEIKVGFVNKGPGLAINLELSAEHPLFRFGKVRYLASLPIDKGGDSPLKVEEPSVKDDPGVEIAPNVLVFANYEDVSGNPWHSTLELIWDAETKDINPTGQMQVALSGHRNIGVNQND